MKEQHSLQWFLISRFIRSLLIVGITEYAIMFLVNRFVVPGIYSYFFPGYERRVTMGSMEVIVLLVLIFVLMIFNIFGAIVPAPLREVIRNASERIWTEAGRALFPSQGGEAVSMLDSSKNALFFLTVFAWTVIVLLPYIIAAVSFARVTIREFREIQRQREEEQREFDRKRNLMLSDIAHDLRTPMTTVCGYAKALNDGMVTEPEKTREYLQAIQNKSVRMNELINLLFEYVKLDSDGFTLNLERTELFELLRENAALAYSDMEDAGMDFEIEIPEDVFYISADRIQLSRVITNLLNNARKHNPAGTKVGLLVRQGETELCICVADNGEHIPWELAEHMFEPFAKGDASRKSGTGSGLGLSIAKKIVEMHGFYLEFVQYPKTETQNGIEGYTKEFVIHIRRTQQDMSIY